MDGFNLEKEYHDLRVMYDRLFDQGIAAINESARLRADLAAANEGAATLEAELSKYRGMEMELAAMKNDMEALRVAWKKRDVRAENSFWMEDYATINRILWGK